MAVSTSTMDLEELAEICLATAKTIKTFLASKKQPAMTFEQNGPTAFPSVPIEIQQARTKLLSAAKNLTDLVTGPDDFFKWTILENLHDLNACRYIYHYNIASAVPLNATVTYASIAATASVNENQLRQMLRHAMTRHIFAEPSPGLVTHTAASRLFLSDAGPKNVIGFITEEAMPTTAAQINALEAHGHGSQEANESAFSTAFGTKLPVFMYYKQDPVRGPRFAKCMHYLTAGDAHGLHNVTAGYDWVALGAVTVVDVAGSLGHCSVEIAKAAPQIKFVVQDLPNVVAVAKDPKTSVVPAALRDRITFQGYDFFTPQPVKAECYFMRFTLHVYSDKYAVKILQSLEPVLETGTKVVIMDQVMPDMGASRELTCMDLQMMGMFNARERTMDDWKAIVKAADPRFRINSVVTPPGSVLSLIELIVS